MKETYEQMKERHRKQLDCFDVICFFNHEQKKQEFRKHGIHSDSEGVRRLVMIAPGAFIERKDTKKLDEILSSQIEEVHKAMEDIEFSVEAFTFELGNYGYPYGDSIGEALATLGLEHTDLLENPMLMLCYLTAAKRVRTERE